MESHSIADERTTFTGVAGNRCWAVMISPTLSTPHSPAVIRIGDTEHLLETFPFAPEQPDVEAAVSRWLQDRRRYAP
jgi:hypothetical protein